MTTPERRLNQNIGAIALCARRRSRRDFRRRAPAGVVFAALVCALLAPTRALSAAPPQAKEKPYALIFGTVFNQQGRVVYGVPVKVRRADQKKTLMEGMSDHNGEFAFRVPPGPADYIVWLDVKPAKKDKKTEKKGAKAAPSGTVPSPAPGAIPATSANPPAAAAAAQQAGDELERKVHVAGDERVDISLHLTE